MIDKITSLNKWLDKHSYSSGYDYENAETCKCGTMNCCVCGKRIKDGDFRVKNTPDAYITTHRECCSGDPYWQKNDELAEVIAQAKQSLDADIEKLRKKYGYIFDEYFEESDYR